MNKNKQPIFQTVFGDKWDQLPIIMKKHYANLPYSNDVVTAEGNLDIEFNWFGKIITPLFKIFKTLIPYQGKAVKAIVHFESSPNDNSFTFNRILYFAGKKTFEFKSRMVQIKDNIIIEYMRFNLGWRMRYEYEDNKVKLKHDGYVIKIFGFNLPVPLALIMGKGYAEESVIDDNNFAMFVTITHPLWGKVYQYKGKFTIR